MRLPKLVFTLAIFCFAFVGTAQDNIFLERSYWKANPSIEKIETDIAAGNNPSALNSNMFDAVCYALLEKTDNTVVKHLLSKKGNEVNKLTHDGRTYIFWAAYRGNVEIMEYLVANGAKANIKDSHGYNVINFAARGGQTSAKLYDFLLKHDADINDTTNNGANALLLVAPSVSDYATFEYFEDKGLDLKSTDTDGNGLFHYAARGGDVELLKTLIAKGVSYTSLNKQNGNAILMASQGVDNPKNGLATFQYLEKLGLEPNISDDEGRNPLHAIAHDSDDLSLFNYFIKKGVSVDQQNNSGKGNSPFMNAANSNELKVVKFLYDYVKDINATDASGRSALTMAVDRNSPEVVAFLLQQGSDINVIDKNGNTLAYYVLRNFNPKKPEKFEEKLQLLQAKGLTLITPQNNGNTLLHLAVQENNLTLLERLQEFEIDVNKKNAEGNTALHLAAMTSNNDAVLKYLISKGADKTVKTDFDETVYDLASENELLKEHKVGLDFLK